MRSSASAAGFVLAGGKSSRMGRDKALLEIGGEPLLLRVARAVSEAAGSTVIIGDPGAYGRFGWPVIADAAPGLGPAGGLFTALENTTEDWNLVVACDMPGITAAMLREVLSATRASAGARCAAARSVRGPEPLCAAYHRCCLGEIRRAIAGGRLRMRDLLASLEPEEVPVSDVHVLENINTPAEWLSWMARKDN